MTNVRTVLPQRRNSGVRRDYEMTPEEWVALGGTPPPDESPEDFPVFGWGSNPFQPHHRLYNGPTGVPPFDNVMPTWVAIADRLGVHVLTVAWPDVHYRYFSAVPR